jgi:protein required for attachment to host cells
MSQYWVIAADSTEARLFERAKKFSPLVEQQDFLHPESRLRGAELENDRQGKTFSSHGYGQSDNEPPTAPKQYEAETFARQLAHALDTARARGDFEHLQIVAEPKFLGLLRERMDDDTRERIERTVDKNLTRQSPDRIAEALNEAD